MTSTWPGTVTLSVEPSGYSEQPERNVADFQPEVGPPMTRRRTAISTDMISFSTNPVLMADYDALLTFYRDTLLDGSLPFLRTHPRDPLGSTETFKFIDPPQWNYIDGLYGRIKLSIRKMP